MNEYVICQVNISITLAFQSSVSIIILLLSSIAVAWRNSIHLRSGSWFYSPNLRTSSRFHYPNRILLRLLNTPPLFGSVWSELYMFKPFVSIFRDQNPKLEKKGKELHFPLFCNRNFCACTATYLFLYVVRVVHVQTLFLNFQRPKTRKQRQRITFPSLM